MKTINPILLIILVLTCTLTESFGQGCNNPVNLCQSTGPLQTTTNGTFALLPAAFCFDSGNTLFYSFNTLSEEYISENGINFIGNAQVNIGPLLCDTGLVETPSISAAIVTATEPCNPTTYSPALDCVPLSTTGNFSMPLTGLQPGTTYYLIINVESIETGTAFNCDVSIDITGPAVTYNLNASSDPLTIIPGETVNLSSNSAFENYTWSGEGITNTEGQNTTANIPNEGQYTYTATAEIDGCPVTDQILVNVVTALIIYNTITPNGDGINDTWKILGIERFPDAEVKVHSRWGQIVYRKRGYTNNPGWDGDLLPDAVYYYVIELNPLGFETKPYTGSLTIIR
jgi:gliding motility-associated-like protein